MSDLERSSRGLESGGVPLASVLPALRELEPGARACWLYDLDALASRAARLRLAFEPLRPAIAYALKANGLTRLVRHLRAQGLHVDAGSLGELELARAVGFERAARTLSGNGRTQEEATWVARHGVDCVSADAASELDLLEHAIAQADAPPLEVALRINPGIAVATHAHVATGHTGAKFGMAAAEALELWAARARWPHLRVDGVHVHVGSQLLRREPLLAAARDALALAAAAAARGAPLTLVNLGGGFGHDHGAGAAGFEIETHARDLAELARGRGLRWRLEPGRWLVAPIGVLLAEVLRVKVRRDPDRDRRFIVLAAGMNDLLRPALYGARHRIEPLVPRPGDLASATVVGPVCESGDTFLTDVELPPLDVGDVVAIHDAGAYGAVMSSNYNGRGRLAELVIEGGEVRRARRSEAPDDLRARDRDDPLQIGGTRERDAG